jgi:hypothetical protein
MAEEYMNDLNDLKILLPVYNNKTQIGYTIISKKHEEILKDKYLYLNKDGDGYVMFGKIRLHRFITKAIQGIIIDHVNQNKLDNSDTNLRIATVSQNIHNRTVIKNKEASSIYRGVRKIKNLWECRININHIEYRYAFNKELDAAYYYNVLCLKYYGDQHTVLNKVEKPEDFEEPLINRLSTKIEPVGVMYNKEAKKYISSITIDGKNTVLGRYDTVEEAILSRTKAENEKKINIEKIKHEKGINIIRNKNNIAFISIKKDGNNIEILIDDDLYYNFVNSTWYLNNTGYAMRSIDNITMHSIVANLKLGPNKDPLNLIIDHINGDKLDNRSFNLRYGTRSLNAHNRVKKENITSIYQGVSKTLNNTWVVRINNTYIGKFLCEHEAAEVYNKNATELYGTDAKLNIIIIPDGYVKPIKKEPKYVVCTKSGKYQASVRYKKKILYLGIYATEELAHKASIDKRIELGLE